MSIEGWERQHEARMAAIRRDHEEGSHEEPHPECDLCDEAMTQGQPDASGKLGKWRVTGPQWARYRDEEHQKRALYNPEGNVAGNLYGAEQSAYIVDALNAYMDRRPTPIPDADRVREARKRFSEFVEFLEGANSGDLAPRQIVFGVSDLPLLRALATPAPKPGEGGEAEAMRELLLRAEEFVEFYEQHEYEHCVCDAAGDPDVGLPPTMCEFHALEEAVGDAKAGHVGHVAKLRDGEPCDKCQAPTAPASDKGEL